MRALTVVCVVVSAIGIAACLHEERRTAPVIAAPAQRMARSSVAPPQYVIADPTSARGGMFVVPLGGAVGHGLVVDKRRVVVGRGEPRMALDVPGEPFVGAAQMPSRFGRGFLFWTTHTIYRADAFDAPLAPVARTPDSIESISFAPASLLVRTHNGERWGLAVPSGARAPISPLGVADVQALDDGRALGFNDQGAVFTSTNNGAHWIDATASVKSSPTKVAIVGGELWLYESNNGASRLEKDGRLSWFDAAPPDAAPELRAKDARWRGSESPLRAAFRSGAAIDESTALVVESGDLVRIDVRSGDVVSVVQARLPPDARCEAVSIIGDVLFACVSRGANGSAFVVSHTLSTEPPIVEQSLAGGGQFYASDDGGLAYSASCQGVPPSPAGAPVVCVRGPDGRWQEHDVSGLVSAAGGADVTVARWVPRADGRVAAIVLEPSIGIYEPAVSHFQAIANEASDVVTAGRSYAHRTGRRSVRKGEASDVIDRSWSFGSSNLLHGWQRHGDIVEITEDGRMTRSPYAFDVVSAGAMGLGRSKDGRLYQSADHGSSWTEVATPPAGVEATDLVQCSSAGCDLGAFYRIGWASTRPHADVSTTTAPAAPEVRRVRGLELSCRPQGGVSSKALPRTGDSPEDLGLGMNRLSIANEHNDWSYVRTPLPRTIASPIHEPASEESDATQTVRALLSGYGTTRDSDVITVAGPNKSAMALRRGLAFVAPFDPGARIVRTAIAMSDVVAAGRRVGMTTDEVLSDDPTEAGVVIPLGSSDPSSPSDIAIHNVDRGLLSFTRAERVRVTMRTSTNNANVISGVALPNDELAFLEVDSSGVGHVFKVAAGMATDLFDLSPTANESFYPANPDALAVGAKGDLAVVRTPSGSDPPSALDPAFLMIQATPPVALAPWSEIKLADDPACKAELGGYRAVIQTQGPWVRVTTPELRVQDAPSLARVRWTASRVCLEGIEVRLPSVSLRVPSTDGSGGEPTVFATWLVGKGSTFARVGTGEGLEWRQALECTIVGSGP